MRMVLFRWQFWLALALVMFLGGCATPPFKPRTDIQIVSVSSGSGSDEINPNLTLINASTFPFDPAVIQFTLNNGVGVTINELDITYESPSGGDIVYQDSNGNVQTGIPAKKSRIQRHFNATFPFTELAPSDNIRTVSGLNDSNADSSRLCCLFIRLVTQQANQVLSVDGNFLTVPNLNSDIIANLTIRGIDDNDNPFTRDASILVSPIPETFAGEFDPGCDPSCSIGSRPATDAAAGGGADSAGGTNNTTAAQ